MHAPPKISVLLPTYNYARFLPEAIESVLRQEHPDFELIVSDDASADDSAAIIRHYAAADPRVRWHRHPANLGMVANWNWCLQQARGDYVKYVFGDDLLASPRALGTLADMLDADPAIKLAGSARLTLDQSSGIRGVWHDLPAGRHSGPRLIARCLRQRRNLIGEPSVVMFRRAGAARGFDPTLRQLVDLEMWFHLLCTGDLAYTDEPLSGFRLHPAQQTRANQARRVSDFEMTALLERYLACREVERHLPVGSAGHRLILFQHGHYMRKAKGDGPESAAILAHIDRQLSGPWRFGCWTWHRLSRPASNLRRKFGLWRERFFSKRNWSLAWLGAAPIRHDRATATGPAPGARTR